MQTEDERPARELLNELAERIGTVRDFEEFMRDRAGYSRAEAKRFASNVFARLEAKAELEELATLLRGSTVN